MANAIGKCGTAVVVAAAIMTAGCAAAKHPTPAAAPPVTVAATSTPTRTTTVPPTTTTTTTVPPTTSTAPTTTPSTTMPATEAPTTAGRAAAAPVTTAPPPGCPSNLADQLASTGSARQLITVEGTSYDATVGTVESWQKKGSCWQPAGGPWTGFIGENGFSDHHREGDGTTPTGIYSIGPTMYGNDPNPGVQEPYHQLVCGDWWDEDPNSAQYNTFQHVPCGQKPSFGGGSEALWTETGPYPSFAVVDYNTDPVVRGAGSAIFVHADTGQPTVGCVSIPLADLDQLLRWIDPGLSPLIAMGPASEITRF